MVDSHCHLAGHEFEADLDHVVDRARGAGLSSALVIISAGDEAEHHRSRRVRALWPEVGFSVGIHPHHAADHASDTESAAAALDAALTERDAVAIGEMGLDYHYDFAPREVQQQVFRRQLRLARQRNLPVIVHTREAADDTFRILSEEGAGLRVVFHCFTGTLQMAERALDLGAWLSFAGIVTFPKAAELRDVVKAMPADKLLVETDSPYLAPTPHRGKRNEPAYVARVVEAVAAIRGTSPAVIGEQTTRNFAALLSGA